MLNSTPQQPLCDTEKCLINIYVSFIYLSTPFHHANNLFMTPRILDAYGQEQNLKPCLHSCQLKLRILYDAFYQFGF